MTAERESTASPPLRRPEARCRPDFMLAANILAEGSRTSSQRTLEKRTQDSSQKNRGRPKVHICPQ